MKEKSKKKANKTGLFVGSVLRSIVVFFGFILKFILKFVTVFGLWIPLIYASFGLILYLALDFNPFRLDTLGTLYLCGAIATVVCAAVIAVRNIVVKPVKSIYQGYKHPIWEKNREEAIAKELEMEKTVGKMETVRRYKKEVHLNPPEIEEFRSKTESDSMPDFLLPIEDFTVKTEREKDMVKYSLFPDWLPQIDKEEPQNVVVKSIPSAEKPEIYFSNLEPDTLVHEYSDRFELFKVAGSRTIPIGVEYK